MGGVAIDTWLTSVGMAFFSSDLGPLVKAVKFSLKQIDAASSGRYTFVCCARSESGRLALLHATSLPSGSPGSIKDTAAQAIKRLFGAVSHSNPARQPALHPSSSAGGPVVVGPASASPSARSSGVGENASVTAAAPGRDRSASSLGRSVAPDSRSLPASTDGGVSSHVAAQLPSLPDDVRAPELVGGGYDFETHVPGDGRAQRAHQDARANAVLAHRAQLDALTERQKAEVRISDDIVSSVRLKLCGGRSRRLLLADLLLYYEFLAHYCKQYLNLSQIVYQHLAPVATLGISVKLIVSQLSPSRRPRPTVVPLCLWGFLSFASLRS